MTDHVATFMRDLSDGAKLARASGNLTQSTRMNPKTTQREPCPPYPRQNQERPGIEEKMDPKRGKSSAENLKAV